MYGYINGIDFGEMEAMKYWAPPVSWDDKKKKENAHSRIFSGEWYGAEKKDGYFAKLIKDEDGNIILYSRSRGVNGKFADKHEWVPQFEDLFTTMPNGSCVLGEIYFPSKPGSRQVTTIMGCLKEKAIERQEKGEKLHFYVFDILAWDGDSYLSNPFEVRIRKLNFFRPLLTHMYVAAAEYKTGRELWIMLQEILERGDEGAVITHKSALYEPGKRPSKTTLKIKKELKQTIDCFFTGVGSAPTKEYTGKEIETWTYWLDTYTGEKKVGEYFKDYKNGAALEPITKSYYHSWCGSLQIAVLRHKVGSRCKIRGEVYEDTEVYPIGWLSGVTEEMKAEPNKYAFIPMEVTAMEYDAFNHTLRHGKMVGWRKDLALKDCNLEKIDE